MPKVWRLENKAGTNISWAFTCPACGMWHSCNETHPEANAPKWEFNHDMEKPTFVPSVLVRYPVDGIEMVCHSYVIDGKIRYLSDCKHLMAGQTIELPEI